MAGVDTTLQCRNAKEATEMNSKRNSSGIGTENNQHKQKEAERVNRENAWHAGGAFGALMPTTSIIQCFFTEFRIQHERSTIHNHTLNSNENERD